MVLGGYESGLGSGRVFRLPGLRRGPNFAYRIIVTIIYIGDLNLCGCTYAPMLSQLYLQMAVGIFLNALCMKM